MLKLWPVNVKLNLLRQVGLKNKPCTSAKGGTLMESIDKLAEGVGEVLEKAPKIYEDALQPTAKETGKLVGRIPRLVNAALLPLDKWILNREYALAETEKLLAKKLEKVDEEKIVTPEAYVAVPALQAISYSMSNQELREMYANLLAKSMNLDTKDTIHPAFVEIIKQLSPIDAQVLKLIMERDVNPCLNIRYENEKHTFRIIATNVTDIIGVDYKLIAVSIDNLCKQNLIEIPEDGYYSNDRVYSSIMNSECYKSIMLANTDTEDGFSAKPVKKMINKTNIGIAFYQACLTENM